MDKRRLVFRLAGGAWLLSLAALILSGDAHSGYGAYGTSVVPILIPLEFIPAVLIGLGCITLAARLTVLIGPLVVTLGFALARAFDLHGYGDSSLYLPLVFLPLVATMLSLAAGYWPAGATSAVRR